MKISVVLPAYNEGSNVTTLCRQLEAVLCARAVDHDIIVIVQGDDGAFEALQRLRQTEAPSVRAWHFPRPLGVARAFEEGFARLAPDTTHVLTMDADLNHDPVAVPQLLAALQQGFDIVIGSRYVPGGRIERMPRWKQRLSRWMNQLFSRLTPLRVQDKTSGYRLQRRAVVDYVRPRMRAKNFDFYIEYLLHAVEGGFTMTEVPITYHVRGVGRSKMRIPDTCYRYVRLIAWSVGRAAQRR